LEVKSQESCGIPKDKAEIKEEADKKREGVMGHSKKSITVEPEGVVGNFTRFGKYRE